MAEKNFIKKKIPEYVRMFHVKHAPVDIFPCEQEAYEGAGWKRVQADLPADKGKTKAKAKT